MTNINAWDTAGIRGILPTSFIRPDEFDRWLADHDITLRNAVLDDFAAGVPDDVKDWVDNYRIHQANPATIPE